jgi:hypothetical protein
MVVMVGNLGFGAFSCGERTEAGQATGFKAFCDEAVRFTHAYTPSVLSQATVASIFTAKYPFEHGVRHNGAQSLLASEVTFAEAALAKSYHTSFFSGGAPILRRSGLGQGFETFDDNVSLNQKKIYRNAPEVVQLFLNWQVSEVAKEKFASFLYFADLEMIDTPTINELGEERESSFRSQLDVVDEGLSLLVKEMKRRKIWDATDIVLVGLQGAGSESGDELAQINLFSSGTRTTLMIKPARKIRDGPFNWKIDTNVSLVDVGATLFDFIESPLRKLSNDEALVHSLKAALVGPEPDWPTDRVIFSESAWPQWRHHGGIRSAARRGPYVYVFDETPILFNTLTDNAELNPLKAVGQNVRVYAELADILRVRGFLPWPLLPLKVLERSRLAEDLWRGHRESSVEESYRQLKSLAKRYVDDPILQGWRANWALRYSDWHELKNAAHSKGSLAIEQRQLWAYVAARNLGEKIARPQEPCLSFLLDFGQLSKDCRVEGWAEFVNWANDRLPEVTRTRAADAFFREYLSRGLAIRVAEHNLMMGETNDTAENLNTPEAFDVLLALPELKRQRALVRARFIAEQSK